jgi:hypothetical protein
VRDDVGAADYASLAIPECRRCVARYVLHGRRAHSVDSTLTREL